MPSGRAYSYGYKIVAPGYRVIASKRGAIVINIPDSIIIFNSNADYSYDAFVIKPGNNDRQARFRPPSIRSKYSKTEQKKSFQSPAQK